MPHCSDLPDDPVYALCPAYDPSWLPQRIRIPGDHGLCPHRLDCIHPRRRRALSATGSTSASVSTERHGRLSPAAPCSLAWTKAGCIDPPKSPRRNRRRNQAAAPGPPALCSKVGYFFPPLGGALPRRGPEGFPVVLGQFGFAPEEPPWPPPCFPPPPWPPPDFAMTVSFPNWFDHERSLATNIWGGQNAMQFLFPACRSK